MFIIFPAQISCKTLMTNQKLGNCELVYWVHRQSYFSNKIILVLVLVFHNEYWYELEILATFNNELNVIYDSTVCYSYQFYQSNN